MKIICFQILVVGMLSKGETNFYSLKKSGEAWSIAKQMSRFRSESDSRESLDVIYTQSPGKFSATKFIIS